MLLPIGQHPAIAYQAHQELVAGGVRMAGPVGPNWHVGIPESAFDGERSLALAFSHREHTARIGMLDQVNHSGVGFRPDSFFSHGYTVNYPHLACNSLTT